MDFETKVFITAYPIQSSITNNDIGAGGNVHCDFDITFGIDFKSPLLAIVIKSIQLVL